MSFQPQNKDRVQYKFRAECLNDVLNLCKLDDLIFKNINIETDDDFPDVEVSITTTKTIEELRDIMSIIEDSHVMIETLNITTLYNGTRWYNEDYNLGDQ